MCIMNKFFLKVTLRFLSHLCQAAVAFALKPGVFINNNNITLPYKVDSKKKCILQEKCWVALNGFVN